MSHPGSRSPNTILVWVLLAFAMITMPVGFMLDSAARWIFLGGACVGLFLCAWSANVNRRTRQQQ
ncbi:hypothetical protein [Streptomyces sp. NA04227]|uniref:hypothetical protein n=1 Tax=Streptomyces sp. NA04227 TaxID=2742136 RepID=UPI0020CA3BC7|nr:hypothetical protein [Streptomyces sp. NA04227]